MKRKFNITGLCRPEQHYMVDLTSRLEQIKEYVDEGNYFVINRGRQYGKTTTLRALVTYLQPEFTVLYYDFQRMSFNNFVSESDFVAAFSRESLRRYRSTMPLAIAEQLQALQTESNQDIASLFQVLSEWCSASEKQTVLIIDEVDSASNNQVFLDFLAQLRSDYLERDLIPTFQSVILAGVHDIRNLRQKIRPDTEHKHNSPWNIAAPFEVEMSFSPEDIAGMLRDYENDHHTGMDVQEIAQLIYDYTSGYPVLVSTLCKYMDEAFGWELAGFQQAVNKLLAQPTPLFESLIHKLENDEQLRELLRSVLFYGRKYIFNWLDPVINLAAMYGFIKNGDGNGVGLANRIFEVVIYDWFISIEKTSQMYSVGENDKNQFISAGHLDMERVLEKFVLHFTDLYGTQPDQFKEADGRKLFLLYLRPIINGTGNYYIEAQTRDQRRTDVIVDYLGKQYIIELKIWHGDEYNSRGEQQLCEYLDYYHTDKGYLLSFNFNKNKQTGVQTLRIGEKVVVEAVV